MQCPQRFNHAFQAEDIPAALNVLQVSDDMPPQDWLADSGVGVHMMPDAGKLHNMCPYSGPKKVVVGNGNSLPISHVGDISIPTPHKALLLKDVLAVPKLTQNIISVGKLTFDASCKFEFALDEFYIKDLATGTMIARGNKLGDV